VFAEPVDLEEVRTFILVGDDAYLLGVVLVADDDAMAVLIGAAA
jgi:hypothetical protein